MKYFDRRRTGKWTGEVSTYDFTVRLLGYISFVIIVLAILAGIIYYLLM
ncbi:TPA: hypothetical protein HA338_15590 [Methanosarcina acetivorans]|uniref:Uncharacterized protein n=1 Tax=Methanosarcina acetivorans TaxID=2214 RepID=A0A832SLJ5_9EURY|nr:MULTISPECIES: hypothetical protein [Methanosarcina]HIH95380.1 hypothetical protein [Methanosarcina acetivorans]